MKETLFLIIFVIIFYIVFAINGTSLVEIEKNGNIILVRDSPDKNDSAILLNELIINYRINSP